jgi:hypothetical protein
MALVAEPAAVSGSDQKWNEQSVEKAARRGSRIRKQQELAVFESSEALTRATPK